MASKSPLPVLLLQGVVATATLAGTAAGSDNWPSFRGPDALNQAADDPRQAER